MPFAATEDGLSPGFSVFRKHWAAEQFGISAQCNDLKRKTIHNLVCKDKRSCIGESAQNLNQTCELRAVTHKFWHLIDHCPKAEQ